MDIAEKHQRGPRVLSLCTGGVCGLEIALEHLAGRVRAAAYCEIDAYALGTLCANIEAKALSPGPVWTDIKTFPFGKFRGCVDVITAGYPCQPWSQSGRRGGTADARDLWPDVRKGIETIRPEIVILENVDGHLGDYHGFGIVTSQLQHLGYGIAPGVYRADEVGSPHPRKRLFVAAKLADSRRVGWWSHLVFDGFKKSVESKRREMAGELESGRAFDEELADSDRVLRYWLWREARRRQFADCLWQAPRQPYQYPWEPAREISAVGNPAGQGGEGDRFRECIEEIGRWFENGQGCEPGAVHGMADIDDGKRGADAEHAGDRSKGKNGKGQAAGRSEERGEAGQLVNDNGEHRDDERHGAGAHGRKREKSSRICGNGIETQSRLVRAVHGGPARMDGASFAGHQLRVLGNAVCWPQAAFAVLDLINKLAYHGYLE